MTNGSCVTNTIVLKANKYEENVSRVRRKSIVKVFEVSVQFISLLFFSSDVSLSLT